MIKQSISQEKSMEEVSRGGMYPHLSLKEKHRQEREALILQAAEEVLAEKGYHEASLDEIAARVGISKSTVYLHFACKEALVVALFTRDMQQFLAEVDIVVASKRTARSKLEAILKSAATELHTRQVQLFSAFYNDVKMQRMLYQQSAMLREMWEKLATRLRGILEEGKQAGELDSSFSSDVLLVAFFSLFFSPSRYLKQKGAGFEEILQEMGRLYFDGAAVKIYESEKNKKD